MNSKHAYLIMAHNEFDILRKLISLLDDPRNDLYIHIDKKVKNFNFSSYQDLVKHSKIFFIPRINVRWGHFSQIECELNLLKEATLNNYEYYHLISGVDLPIKSQTYIHKFFERNKGKEFIHFSGEHATEHLKGRIENFHSMRFSRNTYLNIIENKMNGLIRRVQHILKIRRTLPNKMELQYGANWFSITHELATYVLSKEIWIQKQFSFTYCGDEFFLQTIAFNSKFKNTLYMFPANGDYKSCMRYIDWTRGNPYVFRENDFEDLLHSEFLFARKFSSKVDSEIIENIFNTFKH